MMAKDLLNHPEHVKVALWMPMWAISTIFPSACSKGDQDVLADAINGVPLIISIKQHDQN